MIIIELQYRCVMYKLLCFNMNKTNHPISSNNHRLATANTAIHSLKRGGYKTII